MEKFIVLCYTAYGIAKLVITYILSDFSVNIQENVAMIAGLYLFVGELYWAEVLCFCGSITPYR